MKKKKEREEKKHETSPVRHLQLELQKLRRELRTTARVYTQRLEHELIAATDALGRYAPTEKLTREQLHRVRDFAIMVRQRRLRPEKGRRKDLRRIDTLISDLRPLMDNE
jgi:hypothetical protein